MFIPFGGMAGGWVATQKLEYKTLLLNGNVKEQRGLKKYREIVMI